MKRGRRQDRQRKRWEDNIREWTGLEFGKFQRAVEYRAKMKKTGCKIICGAPTTLAVKGLMMMMMMSYQTYHSYFQLTSVELLQMFWLKGNVTPPPIPAAIGSLTW